MIELRTLGSISLTGLEPERADHILTQPKRVALLVYLALANHGGFIQRDRLLQVFWPESDDAHARNALNQALHQLRTALGDDVIESRGKQELRLSGTIVWCDAREVLESPSDADHTHVLEVYGGEFLDGFHLPGAPAFDDWVEGQRQRLREAFRTHAWHGSELAEASGDYDGALRCARLARSVSPFDERSTVRLVSLLDRLGDRAAALAVYEAFAADLAAEFSVEPSPETQALVREVRSRTPSGLSGPADEPDPVSKTELEMDVAQTGTIVPDGTLGIRRRGVRWKTGRFVAIGAVTLALAVVMASQLRPGESGPSLALPSVAVMPFQNLSDDVDDRYFADGLHAELVDRLASVEGLIVRSRASVMAFRDEAETVERIARELEVGYLVEATVRRAGNRVRVNALMIDAVEDRLLWSQSFERELTVESVLAIQTEIADRIAADLPLGPSRPSISAATVGMTQDLEAYELYLQGADAYYESSLTNVFTYKDRALRLAIEKYAAAIERDPGFALAWAALAHPHLSLYWFGHDMTEERREAARKAATTALRLAPDVARTHFAMGRYYYQGERDYGRALDHLERAREGLPGNSDIWAFIGYVNRRQGDLSAAAEAQRRAFELSPRTEGHISNLANTLRALGQPDQSIRLYERAIGLQPGAAHLYAHLARVHLFSLGDLDGARDALERGAANVADRRDLAPALFHLELLARDYEAALLQLDAARDPFWGVPMQMGPQEALIPIALHRARVLGMQGRAEAAAEQFALALSQLQGPLKKEPDDARVHASLGITLAGLGRPEQALFHARMATELIPLSTDIFVGAQYLRDLAETLIILGRLDEAVEALTLAAGPNRGGMNPVHLPLDPRWDPLRGHPGFQQLVQADR